MKSKAAKRKANLKAVKAWKLRNPEKVKAQRRRRWPRYYAKHLGSIKARGRKAYRKNSDVIKAKRRKAYHKIKNTKKYKRSCRENFLRHAYGLTLLKVEAMYKKQRGKCAICKKGVKKLNVDHCHRSRKIRGLLCLRCNVGIGMFLDCVKNLSSAINYLRR